MPSSTAEIFNTSSASETEPVFVYLDAVKEAQAMFPDIVGNVFFLDTYAKKLIHPGNAAAMGDVLDYINNNAELQKDFAECRAKKLHQYVEKGGKFVLIYTGEDQNKILGYESSLAKSLYFAFDHELGHAMIKNAKDYEAEKQTPQLVESIADAFACLRHFQRFGNDTKNIEKLMLMRAYRLFAGKPEEQLRHFTSPVIEQILKHQDSIDYKNLSPAETMELARRFAFNYCMNEKNSLGLEEKTSKIGNELYDIMKNNKDFAWEKALTERIIETNHPILFKWGSMLIQGHLDEKFYDKKTGESFKLTGEYWDNVRARLKERQAEYKADPIFFGVKKLVKEKQGNVIAFTPGTA